MHAETARNNKNQHLSTIFTPGLQARRLVDQWGPLGLLVLIA